MDKLRITKNKQLDNIDDQQLLLIKLLNKFAQKYSKLHKEYEHDGCISAAETNFIRCEEHRFLIQLLNHYTIKELYEIYCIKKSKAR